MPLSCLDRRSTFYQNAIAHKSAFRRSDIGALIVLSVCLVGCITFTKTYTSIGDPDFEKRFKKATKEIVARSIQAEKAALTGQRASLDPKMERFVQGHFVKADELVVAHMSAVKRSLGVNRRKTLLDFTLQIQPTLDVVESKFASATAFPSGKVVLTRPLASAFDANKDGFDDVLLGVLIHELMHVRDGHAIEQWATADGRQAWVKDKWRGAASSLTALVPFFTIKYDTQYPITFGATKQLPALSEYAADMGAVSLLDRAGYDSGRYIAFLLDMSANTEATVPLRRRVECLGTFSKSRFEEELQVIVIGSREAGDTVVQVLDFDSLEMLAKEIPGKPGMSDAERRTILLAKIRKFVYTGCAIKYSFPDVALNNGVLMTPTFDAAMFTQHF